MRTYYIDFTCQDDMYAIIKMALRLGGDGAQYDEGVIVRIPFSRCQDFLHWAELERDLEPSEHGYLYN